MEGTLLTGDIRRQLPRLALPMLLGNLLQQFYNTADAAVIGAFAGKTAFAAVGVAGTVMNLFLFLLSGSCAGIAVILGQLCGAGDARRFRDETAQAVLFGAALSAALAVLGYALRMPLLRIIQTPDSVAGEASAYLSIILPGLPAACLYSLNAALLQSVGNTKTPLWILAGAVTLNLLLDLLLVGVWGTGVRGAAAATVLSQLLSGLAGFFYLKRRRPDLWPRRENFRPDGPLLRQTAKFGAVSALHQCSLYLGKLLVQGAVNRAGLDCIAAYTAATRLEGFANSFGDSGAAAVSIFIAQNRGGGREPRVRAGLKTAMGQMVLLSLLLSAVLAATAVPASRLLLGADPGSALPESARYLRLIAVFYLFCYLGSTFVGYFRGEGRVAIPVLGTILHISIRVLLSWLLVPRLGLGGVAIAAGTGWVCVVLFQTMLYTAEKKRKT